MAPGVSTWSASATPRLGLVPSFLLVVGPNDGQDFWIPMGFIIVGMMLFLWEMSMPGFFVAIPATVAVVLGAIGIVVPGFLSNGYWVLLVGLVVAAPTTIVTIRLYRRLAPPDAAPTTTTGESLIGRRGRVTVPVVPETTRGKVRIEGVIWSARSESAAIPEGSVVEVVRSSGVHVVVRAVAATAEDPASPPDLPAIAGPGEPT